MHIKAKTAIMSNAPRTPPTVPAMIGVFEDSFEPPLEALSRDKSWDVAEAFNACVEPVEANCADVEEVNLACEV